ncbi:MAG: YhdH/YhfP family quinone oxidoreductase [Prevotellaceae bacterium]|jgi:putative YhdH/YhfP family quinone oxidoreductase|nr:YhdH/YhfP family quinone oxidoreductase [Prevotellaceae bacterium]
MLYKAFRVEEIDGKFEHSIQTLSTDDLPAGDVLIKVHYSSLNYKDALSATGNKGVTKRYPHTPGVDAAGVIESSSDPTFRAGDKVIVTGYDLGMDTDGGFGQYIRVPAAWVVALPDGLTLKEAMIIGTAGFTSGASIMRLAELVKPSDGKVIVSGATGGVGSVALAILSKLGYQTVAVSGKEAEFDFLKKLGASEIISRNEFLALDKKPILSARYAGGVDTAGGVILENIIKTVKPLGAVSTCGSVSGTSLNVSVFPFILRGISLIGISAQNYPMNLRRELWQKLAGAWKPDCLMDLYSEITLDELSGCIQAILQGKIKGRVIVKLSPEFGN